MKPYDGTDVWDVPDRRRLLHRDPAERIDAAVQWAVLAPSGHNTQPWKFRRIRDGLAVWADRSRRLKVVDPDDRELLMSCAAATTHLVVALRALELHARVTWLPAGDADLISEVRVDGPVLPSPTDLALFDAIPKRQTNRSPFHKMLVPLEALADAASLAEERGAFATVIPESKRADVAELIAHGDRQQMADKAFRQELADWLHANRTGSRDGIRGYSLDHGDLSSALGPTILRTFDVGRGQAARDRELATESPTLLLFETAVDSPADWVATGDALAMVWLHLTAEGLAGSFLNQPIETPALRSALAERLESNRYPQLLMRIGYPAEPHPFSPRIPPEDVLS
ncbi:MAG: hypothetical protein HKN26_16925 [Acidimicrobiales bacterium]|nr:hypothetical protein [Acidimicrobiales bacterium]